MGRRWRGRARRLCRSCHATPEDSPHRADLPSIARNQRRTAGGRLERPDVPGRVDGLHATRHVPHRRRTSESLRPSPRPNRHRHRLGIAPADRTRAGLQRHHVLRRMVRQHLGHSTSSRGARRQERTSARSCRDRPRPGPPHVLRFPHGHVVRDELPRCMDSRPRHSRSTSVEGRAAAEHHPLPRSHGGVRTRHHPRSVKELGDDLPPLRTSTPRGDASLPADPSAALAPREASSIGGPYRATCPG